MPAGNSSGGGITAISNVIARGSGGGAITTTSASFVDMGIAGTIGAVAGDVLFATFCAVASINAAPPVSAFFKMLTTTGSNVLQANTYATTANGGSVSAVLTALYTVVSGDISGGNVAIKMQFATGSATLTVVNGAAGAVPTLSIVNLKH